MPKKSPSHTITIGTIGTIGKTTFKIREHFPDSGRTIDEILVELPVLALRQAQISDTIYTDSTKGDIKP